MKLSLRRFYADTGIIGTGMRNYAKAWLVRETKLWKDVDPSKKQIWEARCPLASQRLLDLRAYIR